MSDYLAIPPARLMVGAIDAPSSKSATNRALVLGALSPEPVEIARPLESEDTAALERCLAAMGARIERSEQGIRIAGPLAGSLDRETTLDAAESGTAARFLAAIAAVKPGRFLLTGAPRLGERPFEELVDALVSIGARIQWRGKKGRLPIAIEGGYLSAGRVTVDASRSSQFLSALLLAGAAMPEGLEVEASGEVASAPYVATTIESLRAFGHSATEGPRFRVAPGARPAPRYEVPGDYSSALPLLAAAGVAGGEVLVRRLAWPATDADALALPVLEAMGLSLRRQSGAVAAARPGGLREVRVSATDFPDAVPALAALAAFAAGESRFEGIGHLRLKESDRLEALARLLESAGGQAAVEADALVVRGPIARLAAAPRRLPTAGDHRIAMAGALLCLGVPSLLVQNPGCVAKSYPGFFRDLESLVKR
jgi:3-phosphoshikimate 1-carboxyvinyltransferase